ncbi:MAG: dNTP triphosphohydrolase [Cryomorphaceae bacterium]|nr:dNTP triphosphohydrolase [Cryomorphaceae bacterium]
MAKISWENCFSGIRFGAKPGEEAARTEYERDYDRIIYASPFRRLQNKTQVFPLPDAVFVHNRLTHSLEVASVGRSMAKMCGKFLIEKHGQNWNPSTKQFYAHDLSSVISAACLAHDIGNPPFGHSGEAAIGQFFTDRKNLDIDGINLRAYFDDACWNDLTRFEGNANGFRLLTHQFPTRLPGGFRLTYTTLAAMAKYPCEAIASNGGKGLHRKKFGFFQADKDRFLEMADRLNMVVDQDSPRVYLRHPYVSLLEAADDICYLIMDWEDAHRLGIISFEEAQSALLNLLNAAGSDRERTASYLDGLREDKNESIAYLRAIAIGKLIHECVEVFSKNSEEILRGTYPNALIDDIPEEISHALKTIKTTSIEKIYRHASVARIELSGFQVITGLLDAYIPAVLRKKPTGAEKSLLQLLPGQYRSMEQDTPYEKVMSILDFVSGMTDIYALKTFQELKGIRISLYS